MAKRNNWQDFKEILDKNNIHTLYHFTDRDNLEQIIRNGGLYSWKDCEMKGITIPRPGGGGPESLSWDLDARKGLEKYVRVSFTRNHPMMKIAMNEGRIFNPIILEIDTNVLFDDKTKYSNMNANRNGAIIGNNLDDFKKIHFNTIKAKNIFDLDKDEQPYYQAEILVKNFIPLSLIKNIGSFGISIPPQPQSLKSKNAYTARIDRENSIITHSSNNEKNPEIGQYPGIKPSNAPDTVKNIENRHWTDQIIKENHSTPLTQQNCQRRNPTSKKQQKKKSFILKNFFKHITIILFCISGIFLFVVAIYKHQSDMFYGAFGSFIFAIFLKKLADY